MYCHPDRIARPVLGLTSERSGRFLENKVLVTSSYRHSCIEIHGQHLIILTPATDGGTYGVVSIQLQYTYAYDSCHDTITLAYMQA